MKKILLLSIFILPLFNGIQAQDVSKQIKGTWLVDSIVNIKDNSKAISKYANNGEFLKFTIKNKTSLFVSNSPFDEGVFVSINIINDEINVIPDNILIVNGSRFFPEGSLPLLSEPKYKIYKLNDNFLKLKTTNKNKDSILYCLSRPLTINKDSINLSFPFFIIKHICLMNKTVFYNFKMGDYKYNIPKYTLQNSLGKDLTSKLYLKKLIPKQELSDELLIKITINKKGKVVNSIIIKGINESLDKKILKFFRKTKWEMPSNLDDCIMTFSIKFINEDCKNI